MYAEGRGRKRSGIRYKCGRRPVLLSNPSQQKILTIRRKEITVMVGNTSEEHKWSQNTFSASLRLKVETKADHKYWLSTTYPSGRVLSSEQIMLKMNDKVPAQH